MFTGLIPFFGQMNSLIGAVFDPLLCFVLPSIMLYKSGLPMTPIDKAGALFYVFVVGVFGPRPVFGSKVQFFSNTSASSAALTFAARVHNAVFGVASASNALFASSSARNRPARVFSRLASPCVLGENVSSAARLAVTSASTTTLECLPAKRSHRSLFATSGRSPSRATDRVLALRRLRAAVPVPASSSSRRAPGVLLGSMYLDFTPLHDRARDASSARFLSASSRVSSRARGGGGRARTKARTCARRSSAVISHTRRVVVGDSIARARATRESSTRRIDAIPRARDSSRARVETSRRCAIRTVA